MAQGGFIIRRRYLTKSFQLKYTVLLIVFMFLIAWLGGYTVYHTTMTMLGEKLASVYPQGRLVAILHTVNITLLLRFLLLVPFVIVFSIIISHRVAGPVYRMERYVREVAQGDFSSLLKLRKNDELQGLAEAINDMTQSLSGLTRRSREAVSGLSQAVGELRTLLKEPSPDNQRIEKLLGQVSEQVHRLKEEADRFRS